MRTERITHKRHILAQWVVYVISIVMFRWRNTLTVSGADVLERIPSTTPLIIASNHRSRYDTFLIAAGLSLRGAYRINPQRPMTDKRFLDDPKIGSIIHLLGSFPHVEVDGVKPLHRAEKILRHGHTVVMFPEGRITEPLTEKPRGKVGAMWLLREVPGAVIVPIRIQIPLRITFKELLRGGHRVHVSYGKPYRPTTFHEDLQQDTEELLDRIYALP